MEREWACRMFCSELRVLRYHQKVSTKIQEDHAVQKLKAGRKFPCEGGRAYEVNPNGLQFCESSSASRVCVEHAPQMLLRHRVLLNSYPQIYRLSS